MIRSILFFAMISISQLTAAFSYTLEIPEQELQQQVSAMMPLIKKTMFATVTLSDPIVDLISKSNEIGFFTHVEVIAPGGLKGSGRGKIQGEVIYKPEQAAFFINNPTIVSLEIDRVPKTVIPTISHVAQVVLFKALSKYPVYKLNDEDVKQKLAKSTLKSISVGDKKLLITLGMF